MPTIQNATEMETDFPRGGKPKAKKRKLPEPEVADLFQETMDTKRKKKMKLDKIKAKKKKDKPEARSQRTEVKKVQAEQLKKQKITTHHPPEENLEKVDKLKFARVEVGMHVLGCVVKVDEYSLTFDLPGGLRGEASITAISDSYMEQLKRLTSEDDDDDDDDDEEIAHLSNMFQPGLILPCRVTAIKIRSGSKKKIFLSINPRIVNKDLTRLDLTEGLVLTGSVRACEDHGYVIDTGVEGVTAFLPSKHADKFIKKVNNKALLWVGQVVRCSVLSVNNRSIKVGLNHLEKSQLTGETVLEEKTVVSGMRVLGTVKEVLRDGLCVEFCNLKGFVHRTHTTQYKHKKSFSVGDQVNATVLYTLCGNKIIYLSLLPHLASSTCAALYARWSTLADKTTPHDVCVMDTLRKAVYFNMEDGTRALATLSNLSAVTDFKAPLYKTFHFGNQFRCTVFGFNATEGAVLVRLKRASPDTGTSQKKKTLTETKEVNAEIDLDVEPSPKKKKMETKEKTSKSDKKKLKSVTQPVDVRTSLKEKNSNQTDDVDITSDKKVKQKKEKEKKKEKDISKKVKGESETYNELQNKIELTTESKIKIKKDKSKKRVSDLEIADRTKRRRETLKEGEGDGDKLADETDSGVEMNKASDSDDEDMFKVSRTVANPLRLSLSVGFSWSDELSTTPATNYVDSSDDDAGDVKPGKKTSHEIRQERFEEEKKIYAYEREQLEGDQVPVTSDDFDRLVLQSPNSSLVWMRYMAFHLETVEIEKARAVAERALKTISFREEQEKLNMWVAYLNLENMYGGTDQLGAVLERAIQQNEPLKVYKQMVQIYVSSGKMEEAEKLYNTMCRKFSQDKSVWTGFGFFFFKNNRLEAARKLLQRCLKCLEKREHMDVISKFAQLEYKHGEYQRGCTMFENILSNYPKRTDMWSVYLDMVTKTGHFDDVRSLFERVIHMKMSSKKMQFFFKKYMEFEKKHGDVKSVEKVKAKAVEYVESQGFTETS